MNPILLSRDACEAMRDLVRSSFNISSPAFEGMIDRFLAEPRNFLQGPWITVDMPFVQDTSGQEPFPEIPMGFAPYAHQVAAFERLRGDTPRSTLVATGTGSGKSECYMMPILDHCRAQKGAPGIKAIIIYPMNALATDQAKRFAKLITSHPSLGHVRCGLYADSEPKDASSAVTQDEVITSRAAMRTNPPDILLTNYKMLDFLLLRGEDRALWAQNDPETLRYLAVDELHTFDGAQGADLAMLIRRLKARLGTPEHHLACVGSSATLGSGEEAEAKLHHYAEQLFGEPFDDDCLIREQRQEASAVVAGEVEFTEVGAPETISAALADAESRPQGQAAERLARAFFASGYSDAFEGVGDPETFPWQDRLREALLKHLHVHDILRAIAERKGPVGILDIVERLQNNRRYRSLEAEDVWALAETIVALISWARRGPVHRPAPFLNVRLQVWGREMARMVATLPTQGTPQIELAHSDDVPAMETWKRLPLLHCARCGTAGHLTQYTDGGNGLAADLRTLYRGFFESSPKSRILYHEPISRRGDQKGRGPVFPARIETGSMTYAADDGSPLKPGQATVWIFDPTTDSGVFDRTCPACGAAQALQIVGLRAQRLTAALATALFNSEHHERLPQAKPRVLMFSDSVQDAAQRAAVTEIRNTGVVLRKALFNSLGVADRSLAEVVADVPGELRASLGDEVFVARFISRDHTWRNEYVELTRTGRLNGGLATDVATRLGWEFLSDLTYRSHTSQTLEAARLVALGIEEERLAATVDRAHTELQVAVAAHLLPEKAELRVLIVGLLDEMRRLGAVDVDYIRRALVNARHPKGLNYFAAQAEMGLRAHNVLPAPDHRMSAAPRPVARRSGLPGFATLLAQGRTNWFTAWLDAFFLHRDIVAPSHYPAIIDALFTGLANTDLIRRHASARDAGIAGWLLDPEAITVTRKVTSISCSACRHQDVVPAHTADWARPCRRIGCRGTMAPSDTRPAHLSRLLSTNRNHRAVAREHTGILEADDRRDLERAFIEGEAAWHPNTISATPTLEMGIDIGDLSTLLLCTVPPEAANYVQRIGRTGRRDGNSLNVTFAAARPHDLQYWEDPSAMLGGEVPAPGVQLGAEAVLRRQAAAFSLDCMVASEKDDVSYGKVRNALKSLETNDPSGIVNRWMAFAETNGGILSEAFLAMLPAPAKAHTGIGTAIGSWLTGSDEASMRWAIRAVFDSAIKEREALRSTQKTIDAERKRLQRLVPPPADLDKRLEALKAERAEISATIEGRINNVQVLEFLTDRGILPNYAFPEDGVHLKSIILRNPRGPRRDDQNDRRDNLVIREYVRPAATALSELAPFQTFYAEGREVQVDRIELDTDTIQSWRFCPNCVHTSEEHAASGDACPKCGDVMWADGGASGPVVALRSVTATKRESDASIKDRDERDVRRFVRRMFPAYDNAAIIEAYATKPGSDLTFGYEFIGSCEFRDVNFGEEIDAPAGRVVAGESLKARPFLICKHCGRLQRFRPREDASGDHSYACVVQRESLPIDTWLVETTLMRRFTTEALRVVVPGGGAADDDEIKSFVAGFDLGMRRHFEGRIDHLRSAIVEERVVANAGMRSLYIYDSVPGGSGYLRQIAEDPGTLRRVFVQALELLRSCPCDGEGRDGCHRCVCGYRHLFGRGEPSRSTAQSMFEAVLDAWDDLVRSERSINDDLRDDLVNSALEGRFIDRLVAAYGEGALKLKIDPLSRRAYQLTVPDAAGKPRRWFLRAQVPIDKEYPGAPKRVVDYLLEPVVEGSAKPIVIELDGWEYHAGEIGSDLMTRLALIRKFGLDVVTLTWDDLSPTAAPTVPNPYALQAFGAAMQGQLAKIWSAEAFKRVHPAKSDVECLTEDTSCSAPWIALRARLEGRHSGALAPALANMLAVMVGKRPLADLPGIGTLSDDARLFLEEATFFTNLAADRIKVYVGAPSGKPMEQLDAPEKFRILLVADFPEHVRDPMEQKALVPSWRGLWRLITLLQDMPGLHVVHPSAPDLSAPTAKPEVDAWKDVLELTYGRAQAILEAMRTVGGPVPDLLGTEVMAGDAVAGEIEIGWSDLQVGFVYSAFERPGWTLWLIDEDDDSPVTDDVSKILSAAGTKTKEEAQ